MIVAARVHQFEIAGESVIEECDGTVHECMSVCAISPTGAEIWLHIDEDTRELVAAWRIDGEWTDIDLEQARDEYADVLYAVC